MSDEEKRDLIKKESPNIVDSFEGWDEGIEGDDRPEGAGIIQGTLAKFSNEASWLTRDGDELPKIEYVAVGVKRVVQQWRDSRPVETIILEPGQKFPDIKEMNEKIPREEWEEGPTGQPQGPWQAQHILYLLDPTTMDKYTFPTGTTGGRIAIRELRDKIVWMQKYRGQNVYAVVLLSDTFMRTKFGGRQRPYFKIVRWVRLGEGGGEVEALPSPPATPTPPPPVQSSASPVVEEPSLREEMDDDIPDFGNEGSKATPVQPRISWFLGYCINPSSGRWIISKDGKELHRADSHDAARAWIGDDFKKPAAQPDTTNPRTWGQVYRGYDVDPRSWIISKDGKEVHRADNEDAAHAWIDDQRKRAFDQKKPAKTSAKKPPPKRRQNLLDAG